MKHLKHWMLHKILLCQSRFLLWYQFISKMWYYDNTTLKKRQASEQNEQYGLFQTKATLKAAGKQKNYYYNSAMRQFSCIFSRQWVSAAVYLVLYFFLFNLYWIRWVPLRLETYSARETQAFYSWLQFIHLVEGQVCIFSSQSQYFCHHCEVAKQRVETSGSYCFRPSNSPTHNRPEKHRIKQTI